jgi:predicted RNase H-like nuclease
VPIGLVVGVDLAWGVRGTASRETGIAVVDTTGRIVELACARGVDATLARIEAAAAGHDDVLTFVDASIIVRNPSGQRECERQVGQRYGRWKVSANSTNLGSRHLAGVALAGRLEERGWSYHDGIEGPPSYGRHFAECYPYTTLVGTRELGYGIEGERPRYKRRPKALPGDGWREARASACDELIRRLVQLSGIDPPLSLDSHAVARELATTGSPRDDRSYKHREDLIDALLCAWTALLWLRHGHERCQVLGARPRGPEPVATIIAPALDSQRRAG